MHKFLRYFSTVVILFFLLAVFGWMSIHLQKGDKNFGILNEPIKFMYSFLDQFSKSVEEVKKQSPTFLKTPSNFDTINKLKDDFVVLSPYSRDDNFRSVNLINLKNDSIIYTWHIKDSVATHDRIINPLLFPSKELVYSIDMRQGLRRVDSLCNVIWKQDSIRTHHALNVDSCGNLWTCSYNRPYFAGGMYKLAGRSVFFIDNYITQIDVNSGRIMFHKSITEILKENNLSQHLIKSQNTKDPIHLNDVQPALKTTKYYKEGDLFLSLRQLSVIIHYRPSTNKVIEMIEGPFSSQHDVDFYNDSTLIWFNNNYYNIYTEETKNPPKDSLNLIDAGDFYSNIIKYNLNNKSYSLIGDSLFRSNNIFTQTEGLQEYINDSTYFVEQQNNGYIWIFQNDEIIYKNVFNSQHEGYHHLPNWTRIIKN